MAYRPIQTQSERFVALVCVFASHALLLLLLLLAGSASNRQIPPLEGTLSVVSLAAEPAASRPPPPPRLPSKIAETDQPLPLTPPAPETDADSTSAASAGCKALEAVSTGLLADPEAVAAIIASPPETRSIADAIVLWNAGWSSAATSLGGPLSAVRSRVETSLRSIELACLEEEVAGPRLIPVPNGERTTFIVIGSGSWFWRELLTGGERLAPDQPAGTMPAVIPRQDS